ncbi:unnamed protein product [Oikopleura dioica]|uniref:Gypsy retrotransposon integrase-like protein 1 n=1 Tax=Oikopleura dioica TaxID=34765 RepID=E4XTM9_OIKDI|nr:unnamed protein product [Oikopleura dioica]
MSIVACFVEVVKEAQQLDLVVPELITSDYQGLSRTRIRRRIHKRILASNKVFQLPDFSQPFVVVCDASCVAIGGAILQKFGDKQKLIAVYSKTLSPTEQKWSATEREGFGLLMTIEKFSYYLEGKPFLCLTDHKALVALDRKIFANDKLRRWQDRLSKYRFTIQYLRGQDNCLADLLSRPWHKIRDKSAKPSAELAGKFYSPVGDSDLVIYIPSWCDGEKFQRKMLLENTGAAAEIFTLKSAATGVWSPNVPMLELRVIENAQADDKLIGTVKSYVENKVAPDKWTIPDDLYGIQVYKRWWNNLQIHAESKALTINWGERKCLVLPGTLVPKYLKSAHHQAHSGVDRTKELLSWSWWPDQMDDIREFVASCDTCMRRKGQDMQKGKPDMKTLYRAKRPWEVIYIDFINLDRSKTGKQYCLTVMDGYSRFLSVYPTARCRAIDAARQIMRHILLYDFPTIISSDQGRHFRNELLSELCKLLGVKQNLHVPYRPQSTGCLERSHRVLKNALYGLAMEPTLTRVRKIVDLAQSEADLAAKNSGKSLIKPILIEKGDRVLLNRPLSAETKQNKSSWNGPFEVVDTNGVIVRLDMNGKLEWVHRHHCILHKDRPQRLDPDFIEELYDEKPDRKPEQVAELESPIAEAQRRYPRRDRKTTVHFQA